jgi:type III restriction enzyme
MMMRLKKYQENALETLQKTLEQARFLGIESAYTTSQTERYGSPTAFKPYQPLAGLEGIPYVCLRLPTGGGKTLLSAYTIKIAGKAYVEQDYPLTLWLVPTKIIQQQTLATLKNPDHPNRKVLDDAFNGRVRIFDITDFRNIRPQDVSDSTCVVVVSTFQAFRVEDTEGRKLYAHDENLEPHFSKIPPTATGLERDEATGKLKFSFANLLHWHQPLVIVDEAHNAKSDLSIEVLNRVNPSCIVEYTATPAPNSNVVYSVSASELKAEEMIKLPIILSQHDSWEQAITNSIQTRQKLEEIAVTDKDYIRPIILFQAENQDKTVTVEVIKTYLMENEGIPESHIKIATGEQKELDNLNLFDPNCPVRYIITVQALKEGWDCPFAYVLCSVANTKSATAVEQLLGRVLRMPYAKKRQAPELNRAYTHVSSQSWVNASAKLTDRLVNMGFEKQEAEANVYEQPSLLEGLPSGHPVFEAHLTDEPDLSLISEADKPFIAIEKSPLGIYKITVTGKTPEEQQKRIQAVSESITNTEDKVEFTLKATVHEKQRFANLTPSQRGESFIVPQLCLQFEDGVELAERELFLDENDWNLLDYSPILDKNDFSVNDLTQQYSVDIAGEKLVINALDKPQQLQLEGVHTPMDELGLCRWLDRELRQPDIKQPVLLEFLRRTVNGLLARDDMDMAKLLRGKYILVKVLKERIDRYRDQAYHSGYQSCLFGKDAIVTVAPEDFSFKFDAENYPVNLPYSGRLEFQKHYYPSIGEMNGEEADFALALDRNPLVKFWVRNIERREDKSFWLQTSTDKFYPDFVAQLTDGKLLVVEYKGAYLDNTDTQEKELLGQVWAKKSGHLFLMAWKKSSQGWDVYQQLNNLLTNT